MKFAETTKAEVSEHTKSKFTVELVQFPHPQVHEDQHKRASAYYALYLLKKMALIRGMPLMNVAVDSMETNMLLKEQQQAIKSGVIEGIDNGEFVPTAEKWNR